MPKTGPADIKLEDLGRDELLWLLQNYGQVSHRMVGEARWVGLHEAARREYKVYQERTTVADDLDVKAMEALEYATAGMRLSDRARSSRWAAQEDAQAAARRARDKARSSYARYRKMVDEADRMRDHLGRLDVWAS